ncbi:MAG: coproporphyrinogen-III oxidase family protein [Planctomycetota bacterium]
MRDHGPPAPPSSLYVHIPFCRDRCTYCAFPTRPDDNSLHLPLVEAILREAGSYPEVCGLRTLYLGGGTPGLLSLDSLDKLCSGLAKRFQLVQAAEITLEVNPLNVSRASLSAWASFGVTRLSVGVQTFRDNALAGFGRLHDARQSHSALSLISSQWPGSWSADLLVGWKSQSAADVLADLIALVRYGPPHVSVYGLTIEKGTPLAAEELAGAVVRVDADRFADFDDRWSDVLEGSQFERYEVSNFAKSGHRSRHNQAYWMGDSVIGLGPGATTSLHPLRWTNVRSTESYLSACSRRRGLRESCERIAPSSRFVELLGTGLRTVGGLSMTELDRRFGPTWLSRLGPKGAQLIDSGHLTLAEGRLRTPRKHMAKVDRILLELFQSQSITV